MVPANPQKPSCVVLGGAGFIGTNLCRGLVAAGFRVRAFGRRCLFPEALEGVEWYQGDFGDSTALASAIQTFDVVFHLVHSTTPQIANLDMTEDARRNIVSSLALMDLSRRLGVRRTIFVSSGGTIYGNAQQVPTPETAATEPVTSYGISKLAIEKYLGLHEHLYGLDYRVLRLANPFGPFQVPNKNQGVVAALVSRAVRNEKIEIWGDGSVIRDFIYISDVVEVLIAAISDRSSMRVFNVGSGKGRSLNEVISEIERLLNRRLDIRRLPGRPHDLAVSVVDVARAKEFLNWSPRTSFDVGLQRTIEWWQARK